MIAPMSARTEKSHRPIDGPDAVIIGAGHNGLVAANILADEGWDVVVYETNETPGGAVRSGEAIEPGYVNDLFSAFYPLAVASPVIRDLHLEDFGLVWRHSPAVLAHVFPDDRCAVLSRDRALTAESVDSFAAGDGAAWIELVEEWDAIDTEVINALLTPFPPVRTGVKLLRTLGVAHAARLARLALLPVRRFADERFAGEGAKILLGGNALHADISPESAGSAIFGWLLAMLGQTTGFPAPEGGSGALTASLVARLESRGGQLHCGQRVSAVVMTDGVATGVRLATGEVVSAKRAVLADTAALSLYRDLVGAQHLPASLVADLEAFQWDTSTLKVNWTLNTPVPWTAQGAHGAGTVHLGVDFDGLTYHAAALATRRRPDPPLLLMGQMTTTDPTRSPAGTETAWAYTHLPRALADQPDEVAAQVEAVEAAIERNAPGFGATVRGRMIQAPADLQASNANLVGGAVNGGTAGLHQQLIFRPSVGLARAETPIDRLYLASAAAHPGGGVHGSPGANAAHAALLRESGLGLRSKAIRKLMKSLTG
jgi:phytoene dehydrogenase-like protein